MSVWKRIDLSHNLPHIAVEDYCVFAREFKARQGYGAGETNQLIFNFKKNPIHKNEDQWKYRERDVKRFAEEAATLFGANSGASITAIPSSKTKNHPEYDFRFEDTFSHLLTLKQNLIVEWPVTIIETTQAAHQDGFGTREPSHIKSNYKWDGFQVKTPDILVIFDDVITTGSHFRAMSDFIVENGFTGKIVGLFWARSVFPSAQDDFESI